MSLLVIGLSHHTAPVEVREQFAFGEHAIPVALESLRTAGLAREAVLLSTCNRVELYAAVEGDAREVGRVLREFLIHDRRCAAPADGVLYTLSEQAAVEHLFAVAAGLDSLVLGETEILGQLKQAYSRALGGGFTGRRLNRAFQRAFSVAKQIRTETQIQRGNTSVASVAVDLAERIFDVLDYRDVMVIGAGDTSEKTARALMGRGARSLIVSNRSFDRAAVLAEELGGRAIHFDAWEREFGGVDIIISSTSAPHYVLDCARLQKLMAGRSPRPLLLIDLAVPRDIDPEVERLDDVFVYNVDHLQGIAYEHVRLRRKERERCSEIIRQRAADLLRSEPPLAGPLGTPRPAA